MHTLGIILLAHINLKRVETLAHFFTRGNCPVIIHIDAATPKKNIKRLQQSFYNNPLVQFSKSYHIDWGGWSMVMATQNAAQQLMNSHNNLDHILLCSGTCVPTKPIGMLLDHLAKHKTTDFIEAVPIRDNWVKDGLDIERFQFYFPFSWKKHRWLFDKFTIIQRILNIKRKHPAALELHLGSQWWCLTQKTLNAIFSDPAIKTYNKYFQKCWIPDESYFQTLAHMHSTNLKRQSLTMTKFDHHGKPYILYDDHLPNLYSSSYFIARKAYSGAEKIYKMIAADMPKQKPATPIEQYLQDNNTFGKGYKNAGKMPLGKYALNDRTANRFTVIIGAWHLFENLQEWLNQHENIYCLGRLFHKDHVDFNKNTDIMDGNLTANKHIRNSWSEQFISNVIYNNRSKHVIFFFNMGDNGRAYNAIFKDKNAHVIVIDNAWILDILKNSLTNDNYLSKARLLYSHACTINNAIERVSTCAKITHLPLDSIINNPNHLFDAIFKNIPHITPLDKTKPKIIINYDKLQTIITELDHSNIISKPSISKGNSPSHD